MARFSLTQLSIFTVACAVYFGAMPVMCMRLRALGGADIDASFMYLATVSWLVLTIIYVWWRQLTPLCVNLLMPASILFMGILMLLLDDEVEITAGNVVGAVAGPGCWAGVLFSFPVSLILLLVSAVRGQRTDPVTKSLLRRLSSTRLAGRLVHERRQVASFDDNGPDSSGAHASSTHGSKQR